MDFREDMSLHHSLYLFLFAPGPRLRLLSRAGETSDPLQEYFTGIGWLFSKAGLVIIIVFSE